MHNVATIYRFKTPLLDVKNKMGQLKIIFKHVENYLNSEDLKVFSEDVKWNTYNFKILNFGNLWKVIFSSL